MTLRRRDCIMKKLNQLVPVFWKGRRCKAIKWNTLNLGGKLKIKVNDRFFEVDISELSNEKE